MTLSSTQTGTIMAPEDEWRFLEYAFEDPDVHLITDVRFPTKAIPHTRSTDPGPHPHCALWNKAMLPAPVVEYIPTCNDYYLRSEASLIQYLRSPLQGTSIAPGRIALMTHLVEPRRWYESLRKWLKKNFRNTFVFASDFNPSVGSKMASYWAGPAAIERARSGWKLKANGTPEFSLYYYEKKDEASVLARYRAQHRFVAVGRVQNVTMTGSVGYSKELIVDLALSTSEGHPLPFTQYRGRFSIDGPDVDAGDEVACTFGENILGRHSEPWEPGSLRKLTPKSRERTLRAMIKSHLR